MEVTSPVAYAFPSPRSGVMEFTTIDRDIVELNLLLPRSQVAALEVCAFEQGITIGQMMREWIREKIA